jgi:thioredoxin reductase (NADPH)
MSKYEVIIIGGGPAGLAAGLYTSRAGLNSLLLERGMFGGQMVNAALVENYPGFPQGISGGELGSLMHQQALSYGLDTITAEATAITRTQPLSVSTSEDTFEASSAIIAAGSKYRKLEVPGEESLSGHGVSYCATCDGFFFRGKEVAVIGGSDTALSDALELSRHVNKVYVVHRRDQLRAGKVLQQKAFDQPKVEFIWNSVVDGILGEELVTGVRLRDTKTGKLTALNVAGVFVAIGSTPNSQWLSGIVEIDDAGYVVTDQAMTTSTQGIFAAGDIRRNSPRQIAAAVGDGATAAISAFKYLQATG